MLQVAQEYSLIMGGLRASRKLHSRLLARVMRLPMSFFDSQPSGRLLNRFTKDTESVDIQILVRATSAACCLGEPALCTLHPPLYPHMVFLKWQALAAADLLSHNRSRCQAALSKLSKLHLQIIWLDIQIALL